MTASPSTLRALAFEAAQVTARAAVASGRWVGRGQKDAADQAAVDAMRNALGQMAIDGVVVIGEGELDEAPMLYVGEKLGAGGLEVDIAVDPLEGTNLTAKDMPNALCTLAMAPRGGLLNAPDVYMDKIAVGPDLPEGVVDLDRSAGDNVRALSEALGKPIGDITVCMLDRERHKPAMDEIRSAGARLRLFSDGDVAAVIAVAQSEELDMFLGRGGAPEGVLAAAALRCVGGQMQGRLYFEDDEQRQKAANIGVADLDHKYDLNGLASGEWIVFAGSGVTGGFLLDGVEEHAGECVTETLLLTSFDEAVRTIEATMPTAALFA